MRPRPVLAESNITLSAFLNARRHAFTRAELLSRWPRSALDRLVSDGDAVRLLPDVYCGGAHVEDTVVRGEGINLWVPQGLVTGSLALCLYASKMPVPSLVEVVVPHGRNMRTPPWVRLHQSGPLRASSAPRGVTCVVPERALLDAWRYAAPRDRRNLLYEALWARVCTWRQLRLEVARAPRVAGRRDLERVLGWFAGGATSPLEVRAQHETFADVRFREFEWQVELRLGSRRATADMLHRRAMLVVELDGERYHSTPTALGSDRARDTDFLAEGYVTVRFGWHDIVGRPAWCRERLLAVLATRLERPAST